jgi:hypothetical protein
MTGWRREGRWLDLPSGFYECTRTDSRSMTGIVSQVLCIALIVAFSVTCPSVCEVCVDELSTVRFFVVVLCEEQQVCESVQRLQRHRLLASWTSSRADLLWARDGPYRRG